jgi:hypothetical protein
MQEPTPKQKSEMAKEVKQGLAVSLALAVAFAASVSWTAHESKQDTAPAKVHPQETRSLSAAPIMR